MIEFINIYNDIVKSNGDKVAFTDGTKKMTYRQLDEASAKIYNYLKSKGVGKEDFVQFVLTRGVKIPACVIGTVKAGAAFMMLEDTYPADRIEFIYEDLSAVLRIDDKLYDEIMESTEPLYGCEDIDSHDACYAVYTSGSTGNPKGVLHEYGNIEQGYRSFETYYDNDITSAAIFAPFYFVAGIIDIFHYITRGRTTYIIPHDMTRDFVAVKDFIVKNNIEEMFLPPSYLKIYKEPSSTLKVLYTGSEPANGLSYNDKPTLINFYAMSESGFVILQANLNKPYDIAPVGIPLLDEIEARIIDDDGNIIEGPGQGELCFKNDFVRGYINLPEQTDSTWRDGLFHTNDCLRRDSEGNYYVVGRYDDMIKINGNRVEPVEIENKIKEVTGLKQVIAKGFKIDNRTFIAAYYLEDEAKELGIYNNGELSINMDTLSDSLPDYMIPTYFVPLKAFPLLPNGKIARKNLTAPKADDAKRDYVAPTNEIEEVICELFEETLNTDRIGITDDFYSVGGDSMSAIVLAAKFSEKGIHIDTKAIYNNRTPKELAGYYASNKDSLSHEKKYDNSNALNVANYSGKAFLKQAKAGEGGLFRYHMKTEVDPDALSEAYKNVVTDYPFFNLTFEERDDNHVYYKELGFIPKARPFSELDKTDHTGKPLIEIYYDNDTIIISYFHVLTDGEGFFFFASTFLHEYINIKEGFKEKKTIRDFDYTYDVVEDKIPTDKEYHMYDLPDTFVPPEYDSDNIRLRAWKIRFKRRDYRSLINNFISEHDLEGIRRLQGIGGEDAFVAGYLFMKAFAEVRPDADNTLMCRFPINMRYSLDRENTLRNCALPQAFYNATATELNEDRTAAIDAYTRISEQLSRENVIQEVNRLISFSRDPDKDIGEDPVYQYIKVANVLATNLGNIASVRDSSFVRDFSINFKPTCCASIQSCVIGDDQVLMINQLFPDEIYVDKLIEILKRSGITNPEVEEVRA